MLRVGLIGTGTIAPAYMTGCSKFPDDVQVIACADLLPERAVAFAETYNLQAQSIDDLLGNPDVDLVINLTIPKAHAEVSQQIIAAGKHVYVEKPLALNRESGQAVLDAAAAAGVRVGCAPDTFLGAGGQTCRDALDRGLIGTPFAATAFMVNHGPEAWHPNPGFYYQPGAGPMFDMGPYYLTVLVNLLGPMQTLSALTARPTTQRVAGHEAVAGQVLPVDVDTHVAATVGFVSGALATLIMSFDVWQHSLPCIEIYGTEGTLVVPDPNHFGGEVRLWRSGGDAWETLDLIGRADVQRGIGVADMARAIAADEPHRASGALAYHVLDAMQASYESAQQRAFLDLSTQPDRPASFTP